MTDAAAGEGFFARDAQGLRGGAGGQDDGGGEVGGVCSDDAPEGARGLRGGGCGSGGLEGGDFGELEVGAGALGLLLDGGGEVVAGDAVGEAGEVLDLLDVDEVPSGDGGFEDDDGAAVAGGEQAGGEAGESAADDDDVVGLVGVGQLSATCRRRWCRGSRRP